MFFIKKSHFVAASVAAMVLASSVLTLFAANASGMLTISTSVIVACTVVGSAIASGTYTQTVANQTGAGASVSNRKMSAAGGGSLPYALYREAAHSTPWGSTIDTDTLAGTGSGLSQTLTY